MPGRQPDGGSVERRIRIRPAGPEDTDGQQAGAEHGDGSVLGREQEQVGNEERR